MYNFVVNSNGIMCRKRWHIGLDPVYWVKGKGSLSAHDFKNKLKNLLILYLEGQKRNLSHRISKLKEPWTALNLKVIMFIFRPDQLHSRCQFPKEVED